MRSWSEVLYKNPSEVMIALSALAIVPHGKSGCSECHGVEVYKPALDQLDRKIIFPRLAVSNDFYTDRCLEDISHILRWSKRGGRRFKTKEREDTRGRRSGFGSGFRGHFR